MDPDETPRSFKATTEFDRAIDVVLADPDATFAVQRDGQPAAVILSYGLYERLTAMLPGSPPNG